MIKTYFGYFLILGTVVTLIDGDFIASIFMLLAGLSLLVLNKKFNSTLSARIGKSSIPTYKNSAHYCATFVFMALAGAALPPQESMSSNQSRNSSPGTSTLEGVAQYRIYSPPCVNQVVGRMDELWLELNSFRTESDFHEHRFALERYSNWNGEREALVNNWDRCKSEIEAGNRGAFFTLDVALGGMYGLAQNWSANSGKDNDLTVSVTRDIHAALGKNWNELYSGM